MAFLNPKINAERASCGGGGVAEHPNAQAHKNPKVQCNEVSKARPGTARRGPYCMCHLL